MSRSVLWRGIFLLALAAFAAFAFIPPEDKVKLGLDLRGGMHLVLRVQTDDALKAETDRDMEALRRFAAEEGIPGLTTRQSGTSTFELTGVASGKEDALAKIIEDRFGNERWTWSRDGGRYSFSMTDGNRVTIREQAISQALTTIRNRIDTFGVAEPVIQRQRGTDRILIQLPGVDDPERVRKLIKNTAFLELRLVDERASSSAGSREQLEASYGGRIPEDVEILPQDQRDAEGRLTGQSFWAVERTRLITGRDLRTAVGTQDDFGQPIVSFSLTPEGARQFGKATGENIGRLLAIVLDGKVQSAPVIRDRISDSGQISGSFTQQEVTDLSTALRSGALPAGIESLEERTVGASLGADSIKKGLSAGVVATILTVITMFLVYRLTGFNAVAALVLNVVLLFGGLAGFGAVLTLPGIAGIVLTIGMAFDANVLVFERIREELKAGKTVRSSIEAGFGKALAAIVDSNITTLVAALFLFQFGTGPVKGFAVTLTVGIIATMIAGVIFSRWLFDAIGERKARTDKLSIWGLTFPPTSFDFMKTRKLWVGISAAVILLGLVGIFFLSGLNFGIDFTGGTQLVVKFPSAPQADEIRSVLAAQGLGDATIQRIGTAEENEVLIRTPVKEGSEEGTAGTVTSALRSRYQDFEVRSTENVGPQVGSELRRKGILAVVFSMIGMLVYIWVRFELRFGVGALMAVVHDVLVTLGLYAFSGLEFNLTTIAAFLTLVGYSVNDTVVVFDRVRENMRKTPNRPLIEVMNLSLNQTLSRTILTGGTTLTACLALMFLGGEVLRGFAFILFVGVVVGTYSSIYIASPFALLWEERFGGARAERSATVPAAKAR
ncbi:MAG TPA: protein translocase subunit SecD [Thermoanaerobaculia bacterium]|nr:protein translocase subunit SecD [Thermoanaerobaculia bacterium]